MLPPIVYATDRCGLHLYDHLSTREFRLSPDCTFANGFAWSRTSQEYAYTLLRFDLDPATAELYASRLTQIGFADQALLSNSGTRTQGMRWSYDGTHIAYWENEEPWNRWRLYTVNAETGDREFYGVFDTFGDALAWSVDDRELLITQAQADMDADILRFDLATGETRPLTVDDLYGEGGPDWSPDGTQVAFHAITDGYYQIHVLDVTTGAWRLLAPGTVGFAPRWSPQGTHLIFVSLVGNSTTLYRVGADGTDLQTLRSFSGPDGVTMMTADWW
jgi:Tol biopolymer transport system component